jgi:hypothetical protein
MHAQGDNEEGTPKPKRSRLPWIVAAGVGGVAIAAGVLISVPQIFSGSPTAGESPTPTPPPATATPSVTPTSEPTPTAAACDPSTAARISSYDLGLSSSGELTRTTVVEFESDIASNPSSYSVPVDDDLVAIITSADEHGESRTNLAVVEPVSGEARWDFTFDGSVSVVGTPLASGVTDRILISNSVGDDHRLVALALDDGRELVERDTTQWMSDVTAHAPRGWDAWAVAEQARDAYLLRDYDTVTRLDPDTLEDEWTIDANAIDAQRYEGNHFVTQHIDDTVFVSGHPFDAESGEALDWFREGDYVVAAGVVLHHEYRFDAYDSYELSAIDPRTGEVCWTTEIFDVAADDESLWVIGADHDVVRLDPATGDVLERRGSTTQVDLGTDDADTFGIALVGDSVVTTVGSWSRPDSVATLWAPDGPVTLPIDDGAPSYAGSDGQLLVYRSGTVDTPAELEAFDPDGSSAWTAELDGASVERGLVAETRIASPGVIEVDILR